MARFVKLRVGIKGERWTILNLDSVATAEWARIDELNGTVHDVCAVQLVTGVRLIIANCAPGYVGKFFEQLGFSNLESPDNHPRPR